MCRKNGGVDSQSDLKVVLDVLLKLVLGIPAGFFGLLVGWLVTVTLQGSFADGHTTNEGPGNWIVLLMMMIGFFFPSFIGPLVRSVFRSLPYSHVDCNPNRDDEKFARSLACAFVLVSCLLLLVFLLVGMVAGEGPSAKLGAKIRRNHNGAAIEVTPRGPKITRNDNGEVIEVDLTGAKITNADLVHLVDLTKLQTLRLDGANVTDAGLVHLKGLSKLRSLSLSSTQVTDAGLGHLKGMNLHTLNIPQHAKTDFGLKHFLAAVEAPTKLELAPWKITDAGLVHLMGLNKLTYLNLDYIEITDAGLVHINNLNSLSTLSLNATQITGAGLVHLKGLARLKYLRLAGAKISDASLTHFKGMTNLQRLDLMHCTQITDVGVAELEKALPNCKIKN
tara:strand:- start:13 stop:1188 length:1176 start_codon:yes stop_codon:yes gene_type:complete